MSLGETIAILVAVATFGLSNLGALVYMLGGLKTGHRELSRRVTQNETDIRRIDRDVATLKGELV